jgi:hypothetical protein
MMDIYPLNVRLFSKTVSVLFLFFYAPLSISAQWNSDAGVVTPYTGMSGVSATSTSHTIVNPASLVLDKDDNTAWFSEHTLPTNYMTRTDKNIFYQTPNSRFAASSTVSNYANLTDGDTNTPLSISTGTNGKAFLKLIFATPTPLILLHLKAALSSTQSISIYAFTSETDSVLVGTFLGTQSYSLVRFDVSVPSSVTSLKLWSNTGMQLFELAGLSELPRESVVVDLGALRDIGIVDTRHWGGGAHVLKTAVYGSTDAINWVFLGNLPPNALGHTLTSVKPSKMLRYLKVEHTMTAEDYKSCYIWSIDAFDANGWQGAMPVAAPSRVNIQNYLGVNSIWRWGWSNGYDLNSHSIGAWVFGKVMNQGRSYHNMVWDVTDPDQDPDFPNINTHGGLGSWWCNWDQEYGIWKDAGLNVEASIQFTADGTYGFPPSVWNTPFASAYNYGRQFALHFGPTHGNNTVKTIEVGNEPWVGYDAAFYKEVLYGMSKGAKEADPAMEVFPCALQAARPQAENEYYKHYLGARVSEREAPYLDGINVHSYNFVRDTLGNRTHNSHPEAPFSQFWEILNNIRWRNANMPNKKIYVTEWGWDSDGGNSCGHPECVSSRAQAVYAVRGALVMMRLGVDRAHWFYYGNTSMEGYSDIFSRSGLMDFNFNKKASFYAFEAMNKLLGSRYFIGTIQEDSTAYIYKMGDAQGNVTHIVAWRPISDYDLNQSRTVSIPLTSTPMAAWTIQGLNGNGESMPTPTKSNGAISLNLTSVPVVIQIAPVVLPIELTQFSVACVQKQSKCEQTTQLNWQVSLSSRAQKFDIERSANGRSFTGLYTVMAHKNQTHYEQIDDKPSAGINYYRLRCVDTEEEVTYSKVQSISFDDDLVHLEKVGNNLIVSNLKTEKDLNVYDILGRLVFSKTVSPDNPAVVLPNLPLGIYIARVGKETLKF